jgi:hypothetical protein
MIEVLYRVKLKFPGLQKIHISKKWGFTKFNADGFEHMVAEEQLIPNGYGVKYIPNRGPLDKASPALVKAPHCVVPSLTTLIMLNNKSFCPP